MSINGGTTTDIHARWDRLRAGAALGAHLVHLARAGSTRELGTALRTLSRDQLEAATHAMVLVHAENAPLVTDDP